MQQTQMSTQPITDIQFSGLHWIEASAGTGKTYTLSSLMVRILLEKYLPSQVIATTFTRKAAAELKSRIRLRLQDTYKMFDACRELDEKQVLDLAKSEQDPLYAYVLQLFSARIAYACERLKLVIDQLDELFVGTLDSFSQKLLREFSFESGKIEVANISDDAQKYILELVHDVLREWIQQQDQALIDILVSSKRLQGPSAFLALVEQRLNFASAELVEPQTQIVDHQQFQMAINELMQMSVEQWQGLAEYYIDGGAYATQYNGSKFRNGRFQRIFTHSLPLLVGQLQKLGANYYFNLELAEARDDLNVLIKNVEAEQVFKKSTSTEIQTAFYQHPCIVTLQKVLNILQQYETALDDVLMQLKFHIAAQVKIRLPQRLQQQGETTFSEQIRSLAEALNAENGQDFARFIHARFPLILVDEFQDTNQDQDDMLAQIWRHPSRVQQGCMIMVGDRKQAIYGFRGGDMLTFLKAHQDVFSQQGRLYNLVHNHRSVAPLVEVVDALFQRQMDFGEEVRYTPVQAGARPHPALVDQGIENPIPLRWVMLEDKEQEAEQVAWKIRDLLNQAIEGQLYFAEKNANRPLQADDIAVLSKNHRGLDQVQAALEFLGIAYHRPAKKSVFMGQLAQDVAALLAAIRHPHDEAKIRRALLTRLMGFSLSKLQLLEQETDGLSRYIADFEQFREMWQIQGFLATWQALFSHFDIWQNMVAQPSRDNERVIVNLRHISELLSRHSRQYAGVHHLSQWYMQQLTEAGQREWELERRLSNAAGVQLLTIHQSKGLEFKVVFLLGADKSFQDAQSAFNFSSQKQQDPKTGQVHEQRILAVNQKQYISEQDLAQHQSRALAEHHRLWYVALTRASYRVYAMLQDQKAKSTTGLAFWRGQLPQQFEHPYSQLETCLTARPITLKAERSQQRPLYAQPQPTQKFYPRGKTSFSALAQHLSRQQIQDAMVAAELHHNQADDEVHVKQQGLGLRVETAALSWIQAQFPMGALAGNCIHELFEQIDFQDQSQWPLIIHRRFKNNYQSLWQALLEKYSQDFGPRDSAEHELTEWIIQWLAQVLATPLHNSFQLNQLRLNTYLNEFPFYMALADQRFGVHRIHQLFAEYNIHMPRFNEANAVRYLNGSIDLVFFDGQRYHIADYKSNFLGGSYTDYVEDAVETSMTYASYWLQAALYLVALHRYLMVNLQDYQIEKDLGGASYLYVRGMNTQTRQGYVYWQPEVEFILRLDAILGNQVSHRVAG
ncbi:UvrD-helicase domain-containing protein [Acinetobacter rudis]|uniref:RecBCD enzyme subunit RecB n=1 Tax=Acinetobacter rudis TaxID=632955 RepID=A0AAW8J759_9GAMM|nr:UvrD-helicase domain-containing protein [Acinetobacter rudis]MDQ8935278.1 UvrD-helicase domain-containing protein [Acinetobacter rudis]MDQ9017527.1 UvrD-helicase domain-containing protein [Acinetobacter rudis]